MMISLAASICARGSGGRQRICFTDCIVKLIAFDEIVRGVALRRSATCYERSGRVLERNELDLPAGGFKEHRRTGLRAADGPGIEHARLADGVIFQRQLVAAEEIVVLLLVENASQQLSIV